MLLAIPNEDVVVGSDLSFSFDKRAVDSSVPLPLMWPQPFRLGFFFVLYSRQLPEIKLSV